LTIALIIIDGFAGFTLYITKGRVVGRRINSGVIMAKAKSNSGQSKEPKNYNHGQTHPQRPDIGTEPHFTLKSLSRF
jgi:hypothetical protein